MNFAHIELTVPAHAIETVSGFYVDITAPDPKALNIHDISWSLCRQTRFAGHTMSDEIWTVGQHSLLVENLLARALDLTDLNTSLKVSLQAFLSSCGELDEFFSVEECMSAGDLDRVLLMALLHDASEAYLVDLPTPVKRHASMLKPYGDMEAVMTRAIAIALGLPELSALEQRLIHWADLAALKIEAVAMLPSRGRGWHVQFPELELTDMHLFPPVKRWQENHLDFLARYNALAWVSR